MGHDSTRLVHLLFADSRKRNRQDGRERGVVVRRPPGDDQLHPVATLPEDLGHLLAAHAIQVSVPDPQDVVPAAQPAVLMCDQMKNVP